MNLFLGHYNYWIVVFLMMTGFYIVMAHANLIKKLVGLSLFQTSVFFLYISMGKIRGATAPILTDLTLTDPPTNALPEATVYSNPIPHVLILTAIVVGIATTALALALTVRIKEAYGSIEDDELQAMDADEITTDAMTANTIITPTTNTANQT
jgi:multicomponent Na+:H+ antiporter subunit C